MVSLSRSVPSKQTNTQIGKLLNGANLTISFKPIQEWFIEIMSKILHLSLFFSFWRKTNQCKHTTKISLMKNNLLEKLLKEIHHTRIRVTVITYKQFEKIENWYKLFTDKFSEIFNYQITSEPFLLKHTIWQQIQNSHYKRW